MKEALRAYNVVCWHNTGLTMKTSTLLQSTG